MARMLKFELKDPLPLNSGICKLRVPRGFVPLSAAEQHGKLMMWGCMPEYSSLEDTYCFDMHLYVVGTGGHIHHKSGIEKFISTAIVNDLVWHVFWDPSEFTGE